jgi:uncharacterized repeat protein (TIGR01451 family)
LAFDPLKSGESAEERVALVASGGGRFESTARAVAGDLDVRSSALELHIRKPELQLVVEGDASASLAQLARLRVSVRNMGADPARDVVVRLADLENFEIASVLRGEVEADGDEFAFGEIAPGDIRSFELGLRCEAPGTARAEVVADAYCLDGEQEHATTHSYEVEVRGVPAVRLEAIDQEDPVAVGETVTYEVRVKNQGSAEDLGVELVAQVSGGLEFVEGDGASAVTQEGGSIRFAPLEQLGPGETAEWTITARATAAGQAKLQLRMVSEANPSPVTEEEPTTLVE